MGKKKEVKLKTEFEIIRESLEEGVEAIRQDNVRRFDIELPDPAPKLRPETISELRGKFAYSQAVFAKVLNVSVKTVQAWEQGVRTPDGAALRLLELMEAKPEFFALGSNAMRRASVKGRRSGKRSRPKGERQKT